MRGDGLVQAPRRCHNKHARAPPHGLLPSSAPRRRRFQEVFTLDENKTPRMWGPKDDIPAIAHKARTAAAHVLAQLAVIRTPSDATSPQGAQSGVRHALIPLQAYQ